GRETAACAAAEMAAMAHPGSSAWSGPIPLALGARLLPSHAGEERARRARAKGSIFAPAARTAALDLAALLLAHQPAFLRSARRPGGDALLRRVQRAAQQFDQAFAHIV